MRNRQNISLSRLLNFYTSQQNLNGYESIDTLKEELRDIKTMFEFVGTNFISKVQNLKKKPDEYNTNQKKAVETLKNFTINQIPSLLACKANQKLAYDILAISTQQKIEIANNKTGYNIQFEIKLKFLESEDVDLNTWPEFYDRLSGNLIIGDQKIKISVGLIYPQKEYLWSIKSVEYMGKQNPILSQYYSKQLIPWIRENEQNGERKILKYIIKSITFCESVVLFSNISQKFWNPVNKNFKLGVFKLQINLYGKIYEFIFPKVQRDDNPDFRIVEGDRQILRLPLDNNLVKGTLTICQVKLQCDFISHKFDEDILITLIKEIHNYQSKIRQIIQQLDIKLNHQISIVLKDKGNYWKSQKCIINDDLIKQTKQNGLYLVYQGQQSSIVLQISGNSAFTSNSIDFSSINTLLKDKHYTIKQIYCHVELRKEIIANNSHFEFKIFSMILNQQGSIYLFKNQKFYGVNYVQTNLQTISRSEREKILTQKINEDFIVKLKIPKDFTSMKLTYECSKTPETQIPSTYYNQEWKNYINIKGKNQWLIIRELIKCLRYILVHLRTLRFYQSRVTERDKQTIKFKLL